MEDFTLLGVILQNIKKPLKSDRFSLFTTQGAAIKMQQPVVLPGKVTQGRDQRTSGKLLCYQ